MNIRRLYIKNIASIREAEIDFDKGPLASDPLFLITGDTGTGKSTILNAICLALYDKVPALESVGTKEEDREGLATTNPRQLMSRGTGHARVELYFTGNDGRQYLAVWDTQRARKKVDGKYQKTERQLCDIGACTTYTGKKEIEPEIARVVGLTFDQFTRTTMLAQGQFATFMKAKDSDKSDILEKLTGTEIYARIGSRIYALYSDKNRDFDRLDHEIKGANLLGNEKKEEYRARIEALGGEISALEAQLQSASRMLQWLRQDESLKKQYFEKERVCRTAQADAESADIRGMRKAVADWDATADIRRLLKTRDEACRRLADLGKRMSELSGDRLRDILDGVEWLRAECSSLSESAARMQTEVDRQSGLASVYANAQRIEQLALNVAKAVKAGEGHLAEHKKLTVQAAESARAEETAAAALKKAEEDFRGADDAASAEEKKMQRYNMEEISRQLSGTVETIDSILRAKAAVEAYRRCVEEHAAAAKAFDEARDAARESALALEEAEARVPAAEKEYTRCDAYLQGQMEMSDHIASLRRLFADTEECPLCGNKAAHLCDDTHIGHRLDAARAEATAAKQRLDELLKLVNSTRAVLKVQQAREKAIAKDADLARKRLDEATLKASALAGDYREETCLDSLRQREAQADARRDEANKQLAEARQQQVKLDGARSERDRLRGLRDLAEKRLEQQKQKTAAMTEGAERELCAMNTATADAATELSSLQALVSGAGEEDSGMLAALLEDATGFTMITLKNATKAAAAISEAAATYGKMAERLQQTGTALREITDRTERCRADIAALAARFAPDYEPRAVKHSDPEGAIRAINSEAGTLEGETRSVRQTLQEARARIGEMTEASAYTPDDLERIAAFPEAAIESSRKAVTDADEALKKAKHEQSVLADQIKQHAALRPETGGEETTSALEEKAAATEAARNRAVAEKSGLEALLAGDLENERLLAEKSRRLEELRKERNNWAELNTVFGNSDGGLFKRVAQSYVLRALLTKANYYLAMLSRRYTLDCEDGSLTINVIDAHQNGAVRNVGLLSGGESFVVSLALALGLSAISKARINVDTLFIDEGFGTLDKDILDTVINVLDRLHSLGGRRIGIISHVQDLKDRIPTQIRLVRTGPGTSAVVVESH